MKFEEVVAKVVASCEDTGVTCVVQRTLEAVGIYLADDGTLITGKAGELWQPMDLTRSRRSYRNGRPVRK